MNTVELLRARAGNYTAEYGEDIVGNVEWRNLVIDAGTPILVGFLLGKDGSLHTFDMDGVHWFMGSLLEFPAPGLREVKTDNLPSKAAWWLNGAFDTFGFVAQADTITVLMWKYRIIGIHALEFLEKIWFADRILGSKWFPNMLTVNPPPVALGFARFFVATGSDGTQGFFTIRCDVRNLEDAEAHGWVRFTGELHRLGGKDIVPINEIREFTVEPRRTYEIALPHTLWLDAWESDYAWVQVEGSWGEVLGPIPFQAGYWHRNGSFAVGQITAHSAVLRVGQWTSIDRFSFYLRTPISGPAEHQIYEDCRIRPMDWALGCYFFAAPLLSGRQYYATCYTPHYSPEFTFWTK